LNGMVHGAPVDSHWDAASATLVPCRGISQTAKD
jgi:hypothetical protein